MIKIKNDITIEIEAIDNLSVYINNEKIKREMYDYIYMNQHINFSIIELLQIIILNNLNKSIMGNKDNLEIIKTLENNIWLISKITFDNHDKKTIELFKIKLLGVYENE